MVILRRSDVPRLWRRPGVLGNWRSVVLRGDEQLSPQREGGPNAGRTCSSVLRGKDGSYAA
jgi:hypothetical protein